MALFVPFRALGLVTEDAPCVTQRRGKETFITLSVGDSWQVRIYSSKDNQNGHACAHSRKLLLTFHVLLYRYIMHPIYDYD